METDDQESGALGTEDAKRPYTILSNLARGRAILYDRDQLSPDDLPMVAHVALSSMPARRGAILRELVASGQLTVADVQTVIAAGSPNTAREAMEDLADRKSVV